MVFNGSPRLLNKDGHAEVMKLDAMKYTGRNRQCSSGVVRPKAMIRTIAAKQPTTVR